ncbi:MAG: transcriptional repressor [Gloeocapsa sp. DLM2.Bin57]|nr:MAG: transcriptional repressor [Gloeocapsa sp. DLM2.Bin57]
MKTTRNQSQVLDILHKTSGEISAQQLYTQLREQQSRIGLATVYRVLKTLHLEGIIQERISTNGEAFYSLIGQTHHHHLNCVHCGESIPIECCPVTQQLKQWCDDQNFKVYYHTLEFFGLCHSCQEKAAQ